MAGPFIWRFSGSAPAPTSYKLRAQLDAVPVMITISGTLYRQTAHSISRHVSRRMRSFMHPDCNKNWFVWRFILAGNVPRDGCKDFSSGCNSLMAQMIVIIKWGDRDRVAKHFAKVTHGVHLHVSITALLSYLGNGWTRYAKIWCVFWDN